MEERSGNMGSYGVQGINGNGESLMDMCLGRGSMTIKYMDLKVKRAQVNWGKKKCQDSLFDYELV